MKKVYIFLLIITTFVSGQVNLFFSEYAEGSSNNKYLEIYNPTNAEVALDQYVILGNYNGNPWSEAFTFAAGATIDTGSVYVIANADASDAIQALANEVLAFGDPWYTAAFNGDDVRALAQIVGTDTTILDIIGTLDGDGDGVPGEGYEDDPGGGFDVAGVTEATKDHTLVRKEWVWGNGGNWTASAGTDSLSSEWIVGDRPTADYTPATLGFHNHIVAGGGQLVITEIMQNPSAVSDSDGEWFEIINNGSQVSLFGLSIKDADTDNHIIDYHIILQTGEYLVFGNNSDSGTNGGVTVDYQYFGITLANGADEIILINAHGTVLDSVGWDNGVTFPDPNGASMALLDTSLDNSVGSNWQESTTPYGNGDLGTPGIPNFSSDISLNSTELNFGMVGINESVVLNLTISNEGNGILRLDSLYTNSTLFTLSFTDSLIETPTELQVTFTPIEFGSVAGSLFIFSNDPNESLVEVTLSGFGTTMSLSDISLYFGAIVVGDTVIRQTTIYNLGMTDLEIEEINIDSDDSTSGFFTTDFSDGTIEAGDSISVEFQFTYDPGNMYIDDSVGAIATIVVSNIPDRTITLHAGSVLELENYFIPLQYILHQNYPNPFNPVTTLRYNLPEDALVNITIYDMMGRVVKTMVNSQQTAGYKSVRWNATNDKGSPVSAGLYLYTIQAGEFRKTKKMVLLK